MEPCRFDMGFLAPIVPVQAQWARPCRPLAALWSFLAMQEEDQIVDLPVPQVMEEILEWLENIPTERNHERIMEQTADVPVPHVEFATFCGEAGSSWSRAHGTTSANVAAVVKLAGEAPPPGLVKYSATSESELAKFCLMLGPLGSSWARASGMNSAGTTAVVKSVGEARPLGFVMCSGMSESESELAGSRVRERESERVRFSTLSSLVSSSNFGRAHSLLFLVMVSRWSNQQYRGPWSWYGRWEPLDDADQSWTWSSSQKGDGEWKLVTRKKWTSGTVSPGGKSSSASPDASVDKSAIKAHRTFLEVVLGDSGSQPTKHSEPERQKLAAETTSRIEKIERLIAFVGDDESLAGHKASLERDLAAVKKQVTKSSRPVAIEIEESQSSFLARRLVSNSSLRTTRKQNLFWRHAQCHFSGGRGSFGRVAGGARICAGKNGCRRVRNQRFGAPGD